MFKFSSAVAVGLCLATLPLAAQDRITRPVDISRRITVPGQVPRQLRGANDLGPLDQTTPIQYATVMLRLAPQVDSFLAELQSPSSPNYHRWLTPQQFGDRFGASVNDIAKISAWLKSEGLTVHDVAQGRHWISFSGTAGQMEQAFEMKLHRYSVNGETHFANATDPSVPEAIAALIADVDGLHDFVPRPMHVRAPTSPSYNFGGEHFLGPDDLATIYNISSLYKQGIDGTGQKLVVLGRTSLVLSDLRAFRNRFGLPANDPQQMLFGPSPGITDDLLEANLDLEWAGAVARNATIIYAYSRDVFLSAKYAVDNNLAPVMSMSYGQCELFATMALRGVAQQANAQGITWMVSSGDSGSTECDRALAQTPQSTLGPTIAFPAGLPEVTAVGGTEFNEGTGNFWSPNNDSTNRSALSYIPEIPWNSSAATNSLLGAGGGSSAFFPKPFWQTGPGVPDDKARSVPDISLTASSEHDTYFVTYFGQSYGVGGTSASAPAFAGIVALMNQYLTGNSTLQKPGLGNINPTLYRMAQSTPSAFHDVTTGDIMMPCAQGSPSCVNGQVGFRAGPGYDRAVGLGTVDAFELVTKWKPGAASTTQVTIDRVNPQVTDTVQISATVGPGSGASGTPTGTVTFLANGVTLATATLSGGRATASVVATQAAAAPNSMVEALYSGDAQFASSFGAATVSLQIPPNAAYVTIAVSPNPVLQVGLGWPYFITLTEKGGVAATLTRFTVNNVVQPLPGGFPSTALPANGSLTARLGSSAITPPLNRVFRVEGTDANGNTWSQELSVAFVASEFPVLAPAVTVRPTPATVFANPDPQAACRWTQELVVEENAGLHMQLASFRVAGADWTDRIQRVFGTIRLAPFGSLRGTVCFDQSATGGNISYVVGLSNLVATGAVTASATLSAIPAAGTPISVSPQEVSLSAADATQSPSSTVTVGVTGAWTATIAPARAKWLKLGATSGSGPGPISIQATAAGLSPGVYDAIVTIQSSTANPQAIKVPVSLVVGASNAISVAGIANGASFKTTFAPGMLASAFGTGLANATIAAGAIPLPLTLAGVSATVNGVTAPLYFVSPGQINFQIPYETGMGTAVLGINNNGKVASFRFEVALAGPGIFAAQDISLVPTPAGKAGDILLAFITGDGDLLPTLATGATPPSGTAVSRLPKSRLPLSLTVGGVPATILFSGIPTGLAGVTQINFQVPADAPVGVQPVVVNVGGVNSPPVSVTVAAGK